MMAFLRDLQMEVLKDLSQKYAFHLESNNKNESLSIKYKMVACCYIVPMIKNFMNSKMSF